MNYKAYFTFNGNTSTDDTFNENVPIAQMSVAGGTKRVINFSSTDDVSLVSELEQARSNKNIALRLSSSDGAKAMKATVDLMNIAMVPNGSIALAISIEKFSSKTRLEGFTAISDIATIPQLPRNAAGNTLEFSLMLTNMRIYQGLAKRGVKSTLSEL
jgi:hypothetical protein